MHLECLLGVDHLLSRDGLLHVHVGVVAKMIYKNGDIVVLSVGEYGSSQLSYERLWILVDPLQCIHLDSLPT